MVSFLKSVLPREGVRKIGLEDKVPRLARPCLTWHHTFASTARWSGMKLKVPIERRKYTSMTDGGFSNGLHSRFAHEALQNTLRHGGGKRPVPDLIVVDEH